MVNFSNITLEIDNDTVTLVCATASAGLEATLQSIQDYSTEFWLNNNYIDIETKITDDTKDHEIKLSDDDQKKLFKDEQNGKVIVVFLLEHLFKTRIMLTTRKLVRWYTFNGKRIKGCAVEFVFVKKVSYDFTK